MKAIFTFHSIDESGSVLSYPQAQFDYLLNALHKADVPVIDMTTLLDPSTKRGVVLTFDDGMHSVYSDALPVLKNFDACANVFITTDAINSKQRWPRDTADIPPFKMLSWAEIEKLHEAGVGIEAHTRSHPDMRGLAEPALAEECEATDSEIEQRLGRRPEYFAYPFGYHNRRARDYCRSHYRASVTTELRSISRAEDQAALPRLDSYYFRTPAMIDRLFDYPTRAYFRMRWMLRTLRGSHCVASYDD